MNFCHEKIHLINMLLIFRENDFRVSETPRLKRFGSESHVSGVREMDNPWQ
jgi:hypothetical protein